MKNAIRVIMITVFGVAIYLMLSIIGVPVPFPKWYEKMESEHVDSTMAHDPFLNLVKTTLNFREQRDSLQHIVDNIIKTKI